MIGVRENKITRVPLMEAVAMTRAVADAIGAKDFEKAMSMRDPEFYQGLEGFFATSTLFKEKQLPHCRVCLSYPIKLNLITYHTENACCNYAVRPFVLYITNAISFYVAWAPQLAA
jgi:hypothetical protein